MYDAIDNRFRHVLHTGMPRSPHAPLLGLRISRVVLAIVDSEAVRQGMSRSAMVRELVMDALRGRGLWPPKAREGSNG